MAVDEVGYCQFLASGVEGNSVGRYVPESRLARHKGEVVGRSTRAVDTGREPGPRCLTYLRQRRSGKTICIRFASFTSPKARRDSGILAETQVHSTSFKTKT